MEELEGTFYADGADADAKKTWRHMPELNLDYEDGLFDNTSRDRKSVV